MGYMVTLELQLDWRWSPALAAMGMLPQVIVLVGAGPFVNRFVQRVGFDRAAWLSAAALFTGDVATSNWTTRPTAQFQETITIAGPT